MTEQLFSSPTILLFGAVPISISLSYYSLKAFILNSVIIIVTRQWLKIPFQIYLGYLYSLQQLLAVYYIRNQTRHLTAA